MTRFTTIIILFLWIIIATSWSLVSAQDERQILLDLYEATHGSSWNNQYGWKDNSKNICSWYGVYCVQEEPPPPDDQGTSTGEEDSALWNMTLTNNDNIADSSTDDATSTRRRRQRQTQRNLQSSSSSSSSSFVVVGLDLSQNFLVGQTPTSLWNLPKLQYVQVSWNEALVVDMSNIQQARQLQELRISGTATSLSFAITQLQLIAPSLTSLHASNLWPDLSTTAIPTQLYALTELRYLHIANCSLQGSLDSSNLGWLSHLRELDLYHNQLTGTLPAEGLSYMTQLQLLVLANNVLHGHLPTTEGEMHQTWKSSAASLQYLYLEHNAFSGSLPSFSILTELKLLTLQENQLTGSIPNDFLSGLLHSTTMNTTKEIIVDVAGNWLTGTVPASLAQLEHVPLILDLSDNQITAVDKSLCTMGRWMQGEVARHGCYGILCPVGTYHPMGHETDDGGACWTCPSNTRFRGSTTCANQEQDLQILQTIFAETNGPGWYHQEGWNDGADTYTNNTEYCNWYGVSCWDLGDARDGRVRAIRLPYNNLVGTLSPLVYQLAQLTLLDVSSNTNLTVPLSQIQASPHLQVLNIGHTNTYDFTGLAQANGMFHHLLANHLPRLRGGPIPGQVFALANLRTLSLASNGLVGTIPSAALGQLTELQELYLYDNELHGTLPSSLTGMSNLRIVSLAQNAFTGSIPDLSSLTGLEAFSLYDQVSKGGGLTGPMPAFDHQTDLTSLQLAKNLLNGTLPTTLLQSVNANTSLVVDLSHNKLTGTVPGSLSAFSQMNIYLQDNLFTKVDKSLCLLKEWMSGAVAAYGCSGILCPAATTGGRQEFDDVTCNPCQDAAGSHSLLWGQTQCANTSSSDSGSSSSDSGSGALPSGMTQQGILQNLYAACAGSQWHTQSNWNDATENVCDWYGISCDDDGSITSISLGSNKLSGSVPTEIFLLPQLKRLSLYANPIAFSFTGIENAQNLHTLILDETGLSSLAGVGNAVGLRQLNARFNRLAGPIPTELSKLTDLQELLLSGNVLTGTIPTWISQLTLLQNLLMANNKLSGPIYDFQGLAFLQYLDLSDNHLTGTVPPTLLSSLPTDQSVLVDLSKNSLSGTLSAQVAGWRDGQALDLQDNQIQAIDASLCSSSTFQCDGILCPAGTFNSHGRQVNQDTPCQTCPQAKYMGSTRCGNQSSASRRRRARVLLLAVATPFSLLAAAYSLLL